jgi:hypothetical protein
MIKLLQCITNSITDLKEEDIIEDIYLHYEYVTNSYLIKIKFQNKLFISMTIQYFELQRYSIETISEQFKRNIMFQIFSHKEIIKK